jgi:hypothetical protein
VVSSDRAAAQREYERLAHPRIGYISGGTFAGRIIANGVGYAFTGAFVNGVAEVGRVSENIRESLGRFIP